MLADIKTRQEKVLREALELQENMNKFQREITEEVDSVLKRTAYVIKV